MASVCRVCGEGVKAGAICEDCLFVFGPGATPDISRNEAYHTLLKYEEWDSWQSSRRAGHQRPEQAAFRERIAEEE